MKAPLLKGYPQLYYLTANVIEHDECCTSVSPYSGIAFQSPDDGHWVDLRSGTTICPCLGDSLAIFTQRPLSPTRQKRLEIKFPLWFQNMMIAQGDRCSMLSRRWQAVHLVMFEAGLTRERYNRVARICNRLAGRIEALDPWGLRDMPRIEERRAA